MEANKVSLPIVDLADITTYVSVLHEAQEDLRTLSANLWQVEHLAGGELMKEWYATGGCKTCYGRGWIVKWDTMDSMSGCYAEYGNCTNEECTCESRERTGLAPTYDKYDRNRGVKNPLESNDRFLAAVTPHRQAIAELEHDIMELKAATVIRKGDQVVVVKGRKVPRGTVGYVAFIHYNGGILLKDKGSIDDRGAPGVWVNDSNLAKATSEIV